MKIKYYLHHICKCKDNASSNPAITHTSIGIVFDTIYSLRDKKSDINSLYTSVISGKLFAVGNPS